MSAEAPKTVDETTAPVESKPAEQSTETPATAATTTDTPATDAAPKSEATETPAAAPATEETKPAEEVKKDETVVEATPASEGVLGYKAPGFLKQFHFSKHYFWFSEEPVSADALATYSRSEKNGVAQNAAWARESGKGVLFYTKRAEDKAHPAGLIPLADATNVTKEGFTAFSFKVGTHTHKFEATSATERDSWIVAVEKQVEEAKTIKDEITGKDSYKKNVEEYSKPPALAGGAAAATSRSKSKEPKKSIDATAATSTPAATETKTEETPAAAPAATEDKKKERSQSRKRTSIFGSLLGKKDEEKSAEKQVKEEQKAEEKAEKEEKKEEKKAEAEQKKEEAKEEHDASKATEAAAAAAVAAAPLPAVSTDNKEEKKDEAKAESPAEAASPTTEKKSKRGSVFGSLFKKGVTSPTTEKSEKEVGPATPAKDDVPPVSETAPKLDEPIDTKPLDTAAVTAPTGTDGATDAPKETPATDSAAHKSEKKGLLGFIKKSDTKKDEAKKEETTETPATEASTDAAAPATTDATETAAKSDSEAPKEDRTPREKEKRRTSLFGGLGTIKKNKKEESETDGTETKREKSPLPGKIGGLFRKPSKAVKSDETKATPAETKTESKEETPATTEPAAATETPAATEEPKAAAPTTDATDSKIVGDVVPGDLQTQDKVAAAPEVKASA